MRASAASHGMTLSATALRTRPLDGSRALAEPARDTAVQMVFLDITRTFDISFVPDLFEGMRHLPAYLEAAWELFKEDLRLERLDRRTKLIIALAITTNEAGIYFISALPHAFRLNALDQPTHNKIMSTVRFFKAFDRYLSGIMPACARDTTPGITACLWDEYRNYEMSRAYYDGHVPGGREEAAAWLLAALLICGILLLIAGGLYLFLG